MENRRTGRKIRIFESLLDRGIVYIKGFGGRIALLLTIFLTWQNLIAAGHDLKSKLDSARTILKSQELNREDQFKLLEFILKYEAEPELILQHANELVEMGRVAKEPRYQQVGYNRLGYGHKLRGEYIQAIEAYQRAAEISLQLDDPILAGDIINNIASVYSSNLDFDNSIQYYKKALEYYGQKADTARLSATMINFGYAYYRAGRYDSSLLILKKALYLVQFVDMEVLRSYAKTNMALTLAKLGDFDHSMEQLNEAVEELKAARDYYAVSDCLIEMGGIYLEEGFLKIGMEKLQEGYQIATDHGLKEQIRNAAKYLYEAYRNEGDFEKAVFYQTQYYVYRDSLINAENIRKLANQKADLQVAQKQVEVDVLHEQRQKQKLLLYGLCVVAILLVVSALVIYYYYREKSRINGVLRKQKKKLELLNQTKDKFFSIISHDLRGPVSSFHGISQMIKFFVETKETDQLIEIADDIDKSVDQLSALLDNLLNWALQQQGHFPNIPEKVRLNELTEELMRVLKTMMVSKDIKLNMHIDSNIQIWADKNMTMTILRNLVINALKFTHKGGVVTLSAEEEDEMAVIKVADNGVGISDSRLKKLFRFYDTKSTFGTNGEKGLGLGLQLVYEFVELNRGNILVDTVEGKGTVFSVMLPLFEKRKIKV